MSELQRKLFRGWIPVAVLATQLMFVLSFGPACWIACGMASRGNRSGEDWLNFAYSPVRVAFKFIPQPVRQLIGDYANLGTSEFYIEFGDDEMFLVTIYDPSSPFRAMY